MPRLFSFVMQNQLLISDNVLTNELRCHRYLKNDRLLSSFEWSISEYAPGSMLPKLRTDLATERSIIRLNLSSHSEFRFKWTKQPNYDQCDLPRIMHLLTQLCSHLNPSFFRKVAKPELIYLVAFNLTKTIEASQRPCEDWARCSLLPSHTRGDHQRARAQVILLRLFAYSELELPWGDSHDGCDIAASPAAAGCIDACWLLTAAFALSDLSTSARS
jgi:hypothetical protein